MLRTTTRALSERLQTVSELFRMLSAHGQWWVMPFFAIVIVLGLVLGLLQAIPYVAPFIYTIL